jgi:hypothetical protein
MTPKGRTEGVMLRVNQDLVGNQILPTKSGVKGDQLNELISKKVIPPESLEILKDGKWQPLTSLYNQPKGVGVTKIEQRAIKTYGVTKKLDPYQGSYILNDGRLLNLDDNGHRALGINDFGRTTGGLRLRVTPDEVDVDFINAKQPTTAQINKIEELAKGKRLVYEIVDNTDEAIKGFGGTDKGIETMKADISKFYTQPKGVGGVPEGVKTISAKPSPITPPPTKTPVGEKGGVAKPATKEFKSRVFQRLKEEYPQLEGELYYDPVKLEKDSEKAVELIAKDKQKAFDIAMNKESSAEITSTATNIALAEEALKEGNNELFNKLIRNRSLAQSRRGQELVSERGSLTDNSTSKYVKELLASRLENVGKRYLTGLRKGKVTDLKHGTDVIDRKVTQLEDKIKNKKLDVKNALRLLDELTCI